jgi:hypothetical protein
LPWIASVLGTVIRRVALILEAFDLEEDFLRLATEKLPECVDPVCVLRIDLNQL